MPAFVISVLACMITIAVAPRLVAQEGFFTPEEVIKYTPDWHGEDFPTEGPRCPMTFWIG